MFQRLPPNIVYGIWKTRLNLNYVQSLNIAPTEKTWFMLPMEYNPYGKGIMAPMKYILIIYSPNRKIMVL